jgi:hypothetical protein
VIDDLPKGATSYPTRDLSEIVRFVIHHSATKGGDPWAYAKHHVQTNGWPGIGYHFVIQKDGTIYQTQALTTISYGVANNNTGTVNICLTGDYEVETPPVAQITNLVYVLRHLASQLGPKPIYPHSHFTGTKCPGSKINTKIISDRVYSTPI